MPDRVKNVQFRFRLFAFWQFPATRVRALVSPYPLITFHPSCLTIISPVPCPSLLHSSSHARARMGRGAYTQFCFSWYFSVISSNTTLSSCLITEQGYNICLHELPSACACVCVWHMVGHLLSLSLSPTHIHTDIYAPWILNSTISLLNSLPSSPLFLFLLAFLSYTSPIFLFLSQLLASLSFSLAVLVAPFFPARSKQCILFVRTGVIDFSKR